MINQIGNSQPYNVAFLNYLNSLFISFGMCIKSPKCQTIGPFLLVKIKQHLLLKFIFPVIDGYGIIMPVQPMDQSLKSGNKDMSELVKEVQNKCFPNVNNNKKRGPVKTWMDGLFRCPRLDVVCLGSCPSIIVCGLINRKASITTLPLTLWIGSTTTATARWFKASKLCRKQ